jgi:hypothetical protein
VSYVRVDPRDRISGKVVRELAHFDCARQLTLQASWDRDMKSNIAPARGGFGSTSCKGIATHALPPANAPSTKSSALP